MYRGTHPHLCTQAHARTHAHSHSARTHTHTHTLSLSLTSAHMRAHQRTHQRTQTRSRGYFGECVRYSTTRYINFMTTPGSHNDTYAGTCHRIFFANLTNGMKPSNVRPRSKPALPPGAASCESARGFVPAASCDLASTHVPSRSAEYSRAPCATTTSTRVPVEYPRIPPRVPPRLNLFCTRAAWLAVRRQRRAQRTNA